MDRQLARQIGCNALNPHIDVVLKPTAEDEGYEISGTLESIEKKNPEEINDIVRAIVKATNKAGYETTIDPAGVLRSKTVGDLVDEIRNSSSNG
jgi:hypothetical protein